ncbi:hypothetical protein AGMMS50233_10780 [Endomicrobiia bacterium]|nr:hypothetical protein AGMMS50233_10780 [Endomicrobiia bacterium]
MDGDIIIVGVHVDVVGEVGVVLWLVWWAVSAATRATVIALLMVSFLETGEGVIINTDDESFGTVISDGESGVGAGDGVVAGDAT